MRALITGASSGIGQAFAERLAKDGWELLIVARRQSRLEELAARLHASTGASVEILRADLTDEAQRAAVVSAIRAKPLDLLVNSAGFAGYMAFAQLPEKQASQLIDLHAVAATLLTRAALPSMLERRQGAVINVASLLAFSGSLPSPPLPARAVYAGAKAYLVAFTQTLANELRGSGVQLQVCCPGVVRSEFHEAAGIDPSRLPPGMDPQAVVQASLRALAGGEVVCVPALDDPAAVAALEEASRRLLEQGNRPELATRYRPV
jgi:uncharacterized protein